MKTMQKNETNAITLIFFEVIELMKWNCCKSNETIT